MGPRFLIDTNVIIEFLVGSLTRQGSQWFIEQVNLQNCCISPINQIKLLGYNGDAEEMRQVKRLIRGSTVMPIDEDVVIQAIAIRRLKKIKLPDAIIAATAIVHNLTIVTRNEKDFKGIAGLEIINLHSL